MGLFKSRLLQLGVLYTVGYINTACSQTQEALYSSCGEIRNISPFDGEYNISVSSAGGLFRYQVFCYMMGVGVTDHTAPYTYITLPTTNEDGNIARWVYGNATLSTRFNKVQFDPSNMRILTGDCEL